MKSLHASLTGLCRQLMTSCRYKTTSKKHSEVAAIGGLPHSAHTPLFRLAPLLPPPHFTLCKRERRVKEKLARPFPTWVCSHPRKKLRATTGQITNSPRFSSHYMLDFINTPNKKTISVHAACIVRRMNRLPGYYSVEFSNCRMGRQSTQYTNRCAPSRAP